MQNNHLCRKRHTFVRRLCVAVALLLIIAVLLLAYLNAELDEILGEVVRRQLTNEMTRIVNEAVATVMAMPYYATGEYVRVFRDTVGDITSLSVNSVLINEARAAITARIVADMAALAEYPMPVSYENLFNDTFIFGQFPNQTVCVTVEPFGAVESEIVSTFLSAGINQTNHRIELSVRTGMTGLLLEAILDIESVTNVCLAETVIVGDVPLVWLNGTEK